MVSWPYHWRNPNPKGMSHVTTSGVPEPGQKSPFPGTVIMKVDFTAGSSLL